MASKPIAYGQKSTDLMAEVREELKREQGGAVDLDTLVRRMRRDAYVRLAERDIRATVATAQISVTAASTDRTTRGLAAALEHLWWSHINLMLECVPFGRAAFEVVYQAVGGWLHAPRRLEPLPFKYTEPLFGKDSGETGRPCGVIFKGRDGNAKPLELPRPYGWWLALDATTLNPEGESRFAGAMEDAFERRDEITKKFLKFSRKYALGDLVVFADPTRIGPNGETIDQWDEIAEACQSKDAGDLLIFPNSERATPDGGSKKAIEVDRTDLGARDGSPLLNAAKELGSEILLAAGIPPRTVLEGDSGSFALVTWQMVVKYRVVEDILSQIVNQFQSEVINPACAVNGVSGIVCNFVPLSDRPDDLASELVKSWLTSPALSPLLEKVDVRKLFEMTGVPIADSSQFLAGLNLSPSPAVPVAQMAAPIVPGFHQWR